MIKAVFRKKNNAFAGFEISGHAGYADCGKDVVCAAVSSAAMLTANTVTDFFNADAEADAGENSVRLTLKSSCGNAEKLIESFYTHMDILSRDYKGTIKLTITEV